MKLKGNMIPRHSSVMAITRDGDYVDVMICLMPIGNPESESDYVIVWFLWESCREATCKNDAMNYRMVIEGENSPNRR